MLEEAIKHFESLQKRYTTQHNGKQCEYVKVALVAMRKMMASKSIDNENEFPVDLQPDPLPSVFHETFR